MKVKSRGRANGCGTLERRGAIWRARWTVDGRTYTRSTGTSDRREAEKRLAEFVHPFQCGTEAERLEALAAKVQGVRGEIKAYEDALPATALAAAFGAYRENLSRPNRAHDATMANYERHATEFVRWMAEHHPSVVEMRGVTPEHAREFAAALSRRVGANTYNKHITLYRSMWEHLAESARLDCNPWKSIRKRESDGIRKRELSAEELRRVCSAATGELRTLFAVGIYTGLRLGDCARLAWDAVDMAGGSVRVCTHKTGQEVRVPMFPALAAVLSETPERKRVGRVMPGLAADYERDPSSVSKRVQRVFDSCGIETAGEKRGASGRSAVRVGFHSVRHAFVSELLNRGVPVALVQSMVGHASREMTMHYFHENAEALRAAVNVLPDLIGAPRPLPSPAVPASGAVVEACALPVQSPGNVARFRELWAGMTEAEREEVRGIVRAG